MVNLKVRYGHLEVAFPILDDLFSPKYVIVRPIKFDFLDSVTCNINAAYWFLKLVHFKKSKSAF